MALCFHKDKLISLSYDGKLITSTLQNSPQGGKILKSSEIKIKISPKKIESIGDNFYLFYRQGMCWMNAYNNLVGFTDRKSYKPIINEDGKLIFVKYGLGELEWFEGSQFKSQS